MPFKQSKSTLEDRRDAYVPCASGNFNILSTTVFNLRRIDGAIQVRSNVDPTFYSLVGSGRSGGEKHDSSLLDNPYIPYQCMDSYLSSTSLGSASMGQKKWIVPFISFWGDGRIVPFEPFFHTLPGGLEKATINRIFLILHSRKEEREILFPFPFRRDQSELSTLLGRH
ncbi:hypothetical protein JRO89_XS08G0038100 [Xanthoceras sorbifolium]|uniref:Uncharacterized protein ycf68 n=1 Tax=Xanthoceras sorbifolium TaxID=99658 RepID=A0ABQ8HNJ6_9ROSI|nr:hypothetical protein JRO89_XS08G0038100 [Xanthoceras sorbifolium]